MSDLSPHNGILVGADGSPCSKTAVQWAARAAAMRNVPLTVVVVFRPVDGWSGMVLSMVPFPEDIGQMQEAEGRRIIEDAIEIVNATTRDSGRLQVNSEVLWSPLVPTLVDLTKEAQMIVVGCRGRGALSRGLLGSVSTALVHHAHCPVAVIHDDAPRPPGFAHAPVLVGVDGVSASELATAIAFDEASWRGVDLVALHTLSDADWPDLPHIKWSGVKAAADEALAERLAGWQERYPHVTVRRVVEYAYPARHLLREAESAQLVVVGNRGRGGFAGMLLGSVSTAVVYGAHTPVIVVRQR